MSVKRKLTPQQKSYTKARGKGLSQPQSALLAGYAPGGSDANTSDIEKSPTVQEELARIRAETIKNTGVTKEDVVAMLTDAAQMAKTMADPQGLVAAARELGKMLGFYAPEVKKITHGLDKNSLKQILQEMTDDELQKLAHARTIDGTFTEVRALDVRGKSGESKTAERSQAPSQETGPTESGEATEEYS